MLKDLISNLKFVWKYSKDNKKYFIIYILACLGYIGLSVVAPILSAKIILALTSDDFTRIILIALAIFVINFLRNFFNFVNNKCYSHIYMNTLNKLETNLGLNVLKLESACLDDKGSGLFIQRLTNDTTKLAEGFGSIIEGGSQVVRYLGVLMAIFIVNKIVFLYVIVSLIVMFYIEKIRTDRRKKDDKELRKYREGVAGFIGELVRGARDIKMLNSEDSFVDELDVRIRDANEKRLKLQNNNFAMRLISFDIQALFELFLIIILVIFIKNGLLVATVALVLYNYCTDISYSIYSIGHLLEFIKDFNLSCERIKDVITGEEFKKEKFGDKHLDKVNGDFEFKNVSFAYDKKKVLDKVNFKVKANETVAFVGKSGSGKTTIFNLLCKMYDIDSGSITIDGINIKELDKDSIRGNITVISQNPYIFNMSIRDNLRLVKKNLTNKEMKEACKIACLEEFIKELPDGYDTVIGEGGVNLSGGQKQRLAIARALVQKTEIILFDEATSALDNETQEKIQEAINNMKNEYTILIIAHRLSTIINSDRILFLDNGKIEAEGTHKELLSNCDKYKKLYETEISKNEKD